MTRRLQRAVRFAALAVMALAACSADNCGCENYEQRAFPTTRLDATIPAAGQVRITASGLDYVGSQVPFLLEQFLPDGLNFCIPQDTSGNPDFCIDSTCDNGAAGCQASLELVDQNIAPMSPDTLNVEVTIGGVDETFNFDYDATLFTANCYAKLYKAGSSEDTPAVVMGTIPIRLITDAGSDTNDVGIEVGQAELNLEDLDFGIHGRGNVGDTVACEGAGFVIRTFFRGRVESEVQGMLDGAIADIERANLCRQCADSSDCPSSATCNAGICDYATSCVPRTLGIEGRLSLLTDEIIGAIRADNPRADFLGKAADLAEVDTGATVGLRAGADPVAISECVPVDLGSAPSIPTIPPAPEVTGDTTPDGDPFMFGVGLHKVAIEQALWAVWASGATCLNVSGENVMQLNTTTFTLIARSLSDVATKSQPVQLAFVANQPPRVELGSNSVTPSGGSYIIDDPLIRVLWDDLDLHIFAYAQDRLTRLLTLRVDIDLPIAMAYDGTDLVPIVTPIEEALANVELRRSELIAEANEEVIDAVPTFLAVAAPYLDYGLPESVTLPEFFGFRLDFDQQDITSVQNGNFLAIYAGLARSNMAVTAVANTAIVSERVSYDRVLDSGFVRPEVHLEVHGFEGDPFDSSGDYEYAWRVDKGQWSLPVRSRQLVVDGAILAIPGEHEIEVRARRIGQIRTTDPTPAKTIIDVHPPRSDIGVFHDPTAQPIAVQRPGHVEPTPRARPRPTQSQGMLVNCATASADGGPHSLMLILVALAAARVRRRRFVAVVCAVVLFGSACKGGCKGELRTNAERYCLGEECKVDQACSMDGDCAGICPQGAGGICEAGACQCVIACDPGCGADEFCCVATSECVAFGAELCTTDLSCDAGYEPGITEATPDRENCELEEFTCDCVPLPPIPIGWHGEQTSIDSDGELTAVATYNSTYGDLMVGRVQPDDTIAWTWVDGLADGEIVGDPNGPRGGIDVIGPDVGTHSAIAVAAGRAHVFYRDEANDNLKWGVATFDADGRATFESATIDADAGAGFWASAAVVDTQVHVVYAWFPGEAGSELRHVVVDASASPGAATPNTILADTAAWDGKERPNVAGAFMDLTAAGGTPYLVFYNGPGDRVGRTSWDGSSWTDPAYVAPGNGPWGAGWMEADGTEHLVFQQPTGLRYSRFGDTLTSEVDDGIRDLMDDYWVGTIGEDSALRIDAGERIVAYHDTFDRALIVASSPTAESGTWALERRREEGTASGFWLAMTRRGERYIADMVVDRASETGAYVRLTTY